MSKPPPSMLKQGKRPVPDPKHTRCFRFGQRHFDVTSGRLELTYAFDDGPSMVEQLTFPLPEGGVSAAALQALQPAFELLHLLAGISYYKAGIPPDIDTDGLELSPSLADFLNHVYTHGLAEFAFRNGLDMKDRVQFRSTTKEPQPATWGASDERALVAMGGGKDSLVSLELLRAAGVPVLPFVVGNSELIARTVACAELPLLRVERQLSPVLLEMNANGAWNGHVPVTAINSAIGLCLAVLWNSRWLVFSNERSASEATLVRDDGTPVNHQYSKSLDFEQRFRDQVARRVGGVDYFSLLRPWSEAAVVRYFAGLSRYHHTFSSCNRHFHHDGPRLSGRWCGDCPKCRFVSLALAPHLPPAQVKAIVGRSLLHDRDQVEGFRALCALGEHKPFECVGEAGESRALMAELAAQPQWREAAVVQALAGEVSDQGDTLEQWYRPGPEHFIPERLYRHVLL